MSSRIPVEQSACAPAQGVPVRDVTGNQKFQLPLRLTVDEFARIARICPETVRRDIRARKIKARGRPYLIPCCELAKVDINPCDVTEVHFYGLAAA